MEQRPGSDHGTPSHRAYVVAAVVEAVSFLEAIINEVLTDAADGTSGALDDLDTAARARLGRYAKSGANRRTPTLTTYATALDLANSRPLDPGTVVSQDAHLLVKLRNELVHPRPVTFDRLTKLEQGLAARFAINPLWPAGSTGAFLAALLGSPCARWAASTAHAYATEWANRLGLERLPYRRVTLTPAPENLM